MASATRSEPPTAYRIGADWPEETMLRATFTEHEGRTTVTILQAVPEPLARGVGAVEGWNESLDRLADLLKML